MYQIETFWLPGDAHCCDQNTQILSVCLGPLLLTRFNGGVSSQHPAERAGPCDGSGVGAPAWPAEGPATSAPRPTARPPGHASTLGSDVDKGPGHVLTAFPLQGLGGG